MWSRFRRTVGGERGGTLGTSDFRDGDREPDRGSREAREVTEGAGEVGMVAGAGAAEGAVDTATAGVDAAVDPSGNSVVGVGF